MSDIEKAQRAIEFVAQLLEQDREQRAIRLIEMTYQCGTIEAADFVYAVKAIYDLVKETC